MPHQIQSTDLQGAVQLLAENGFEGTADAIQILFNEAMKIELTQYIGAEPYQRTDQRRSYANGFKSKTVNSLTSLGVSRFEPLAEAGSDPEESLLSNMVECLSK